MGLKNFQVKRRIKRAIEVLLEKEEALAVHPPTLQAVKEATLHRSKVASCSR